MEDIHYYPDTDIFEFMFEDIYSPSEPKTILQRYDNYQIYDLYRVKIRKRKIENIWYPRLYFGEYNNYNFFLTKSTYDNIIPTTNEFLSVQRYSPSAITFDLFTVIKRYQNLNFPSYTTSIYADGARPAVPSEYNLSNVLYFATGGYSGTAYGYEYLTRITTTKFIDPPLFLNLISGYSLDFRIKSNLLNFTATKTEIIEISYYRTNPLEPIPNLTSIDWHSYEFNVIKGMSYEIDISYVLFGTLNISSDILKNVILNTIVPANYYPLSAYFINGDMGIFAGWMALYRTKLNAVPTVPPLPIEIVSDGYLPGILFQPFGRPIFLNRTEWVSESTEIVKLAANNNYWQNDFTQYQDIGTRSEIINNFGSNVNSILANIWHIERQTDGSRGTLIMDSPRTIEIHAALEASKYSLNPLDRTKPRVTNIGHLVEKIAFLLGYRPEPDGNFKKAAEDARIREIIPASRKVDPVKVGVNNFGEGGMLLKRLNNQFSGDEIIDDECVIVYDLLQIMAEYQDQSNLAFGIQESSAVEVNNDTGTAKYNNQLEILVDLITMVRDSQEMIRASLVSGLVTQGQTAEIIAGIGLPSVTKTIPIKIDGKDTHIPYKGIAAHRSLSQEIATCTYNVGIITGQLI